MGTLIRLSAQQQNFNKSVKATKVPTKTSKTNKKVKSEEDKDSHTTSYNGKFFVIDLELYNAHILVSIEQDPEDVVIALVEHGVIPSLESPSLKMYMEPFMDMKSTNLARTAMYENGVIAIRLTHFDEGNIEDMATLVHELSHACMYTFDRIGMPHNADTDEAYGYLIGFLMRKFTENVR